MNRCRFLSRQRPTSLATHQKLKELSWEVLIYLIVLPYSPDLAISDLATSDFAMSDYHLFRSLQNSLNGVKLISIEVCENLVAVFRPEITEVLQ